MRPGEFDRERLPRGRRRKRQSGERHQRWVLGRARLHRPPTPPVAVPTPAPAKRKAVRLTVNARWGKTSSTGGRKATLAVAIAKGGASTGRVRVRVTGTLKGRSYARTRTVTLKRGGAAFKLTVPKGVRRLKATARYGGSKDFMPASKTRAFRVPTS